MKDKYLIFDANLTGHHLEYIHHLYVGARKHREKDFVFLLPEMIKMKRQIYKDTENVKILYLKESELSKCNTKSLFCSSWNRASIIRKYSKKEDVTHIFLIMLMLHMPLLLFFIPRRITVSGILYRIYLYDKISWKRLLMEKIRYFFMLRGSTVTKIFVLNDLYAVNKLNEIWYTTKFVYLPDPIPCFCESEVFEVRKKLGILPSDRIFLHFGELTGRKGTIDILEAISMLSNDNSQGKAFIFAGVVHDDIKARFYSLFLQLKNRVKIFVFDEFCSYEFLASLVFSCDYILIPYKNTNQSSAMLAWASFFGKPLVAPKMGLLGKLIQIYKLGFLLDTIDSLGIKCFIENPGNIVLSDMYREEHSSSNFYNTILNA